MVSHLRTPPRFVPTLTAVVELPPEPAPTPSLDETVAEEVAPVESQLAFQNPEEEKAAIRSDPALSDAEAFRFEEGLIHRVLQRVDLSLEARLTDTVSAAVQQQLDNMVPKLREEIETVLRTLVIEALAQELSGNTGSATALTPPSLG